MLVELVVLVKQFGLVLLVELVVLVKQFGLVLLVLLVKFVKLVLLVELTLRTSWLPAGIQDLQILELLPKVTSFFNFFWFNQSN